MTGGQQVIVSAAVSNDQRINYVLNAGAIAPNNADKNDSIADELLDQSMQSRRVTVRAVQNDFLRVWHDDALGQNLATWAARRVWRLALGEFIENHWVPLDGSLPLQGAG